VKPIFRPVSVSTWFPILEGIWGRNRTTLPITRKSPIAGAPGSGSCDVVVVVNMRIESEFTEAGSTGLVKVNSSGAFR
jgi:hypothetical protein